MFIQEKQTNVEPWTSSPGPVLLKCSFQSKVNIEFLEQILIILEFLST